jgi:hypothetical protein
MSVFGLDFVKGLMKADTILYYRNVIFAAESGGTAGLPGAPSLRRPGTDALRTGRSR